MVGCIHYQSNYGTHTDSQLIKKFLLGWCASCYIAPAHGMFAFNLFHVSHNFKNYYLFQASSQPLFNNYLCGIFPWGTYPRSTFQSRQLGECRRLLSYCRPLQRDTGQSSLARSCLVGRCYPLRC